MVACASGRSSLGTNLLPQLKLESYDTSRDNLDATGAVGGKPAGIENSYTCDDAELAQAMESCELRSERSQGQPDRPPSAPC